MCIKSRYISLICTSIHSQGYRRPRLWQRKVFGTGTPFTQTRAPPPPRPKPSTRLRTRRSQLLSMPLSAVPCPTPHPLREGHTVWDDGYRGVERGVIEGGRGRRAPAHFYSPRRRIAALTLAAGVALQETGHCRTQNAGRRRPGCIARLLAPPRRLLGPSASGQWPVAGCHGWYGACARMCWRGGHVSTAQWSV